MKPGQKLKNGFSIILVKKSEDHFIVLCLSSDQNKFAVWLCDKNGHCYSGSYFDIGNEWNMIENSQFTKAIIEYNRRK
ncbi:MAG: hypothetical protein ACXAAH_05555 [Promethearchaeota archaeon]|jgi:hypothetical protein